MKSLISEQLSKINEHLAVHDTDDHVKYDITYHLSGGGMYYVAILNKENKFEFLESTQWLVDNVGLKLHEIQKLEHLGKSIEEGALC